MTTPVQRICTENLPRAHGFETLRVEGRIPKGLFGTLYRTGPGLFERFGKRYTHLFEADGAVTAVRIQDGAASGASRIIKSSGLLEEESAGRPLYGSVAPWRRRFLNVHTGRRKNIANTNILCWQSELLALVESARPTRIDPTTLAFRGETKLGVVRGPLSAHPHHVPRHRAHFTYGVRYGRNTKIELYVLPDEGAARHLATVPLSLPPMLHDFMATERHLVFFVPPASLSVPKVMLQIGGFADAWKWRPERGTEILLVPIDRPDEPIRFSVDPFFQWHFANGYERGDELLIDFLHYDDFSSFSAIGRAEQGGARGGTYRRAVIDPKRKTLRMERLFDVQADFPRIHPAKDATGHRFVWLVTEETPQRLIRFDTTSGAFEAHTFDAAERASEAVVVPTGPDELAAYALSLVYDDRARASHLALFDARAPNDGPIARAWFDHHIPITFHGSWVAKA